MKTLEFCVDITKIHLYYDLQCIQNSFRFRSRKLATYLLTIQHQSNTKTDTKCKCRCLSKYLPTNVLYFTITCCPVLEEMCIALIYPYMGPIPYVSEVWKMFTFFGSPVDILMVAQYLFIPWI